ncbi:hypothetical protein [Marisediminicola sp. LYQ85]|uniref:hypothetical protein n=1 Tax=Marisediminicola sp. LYQ85 TaxID=3391062 RepID=UPI0039832DFA
MTDGEGATGDGYAVTWPDFAKATHPLGDWVWPDLNLGLDFSSFAPKIELPWSSTLPPAFSADFFRIAGLTEVHDGVRARMEAVVSPLLEPILSSIRASIGQIVLPSIPLYLQSILGALPDHDLRRSALPANIASSSSAPEFELLRLWMDEGLPVAHVPRAETLDLLAAAQSAAARRSIYGQRWRGILNDCDALLDEATTTRTAAIVGQTKKAIIGIRSGHTDLAQAFAGNALDTAISQTFPAKYYREWISSKSVGDPESQSLRRFFMLAQLQAVHRRYVPGDSVPSTFNRHATVHGVGLGRQYSRLNAVLAIAHLTSFVRFIEIEFSRRPGQ